MLNVPDAESPSPQLVPSRVAASGSSIGTLAQNAPAQRADSPFGRAHAEFEPAAPQAGRSPTTRNNPWSGVEAEPLAPAQSAIRQVSASESVEAPPTGSPDTVEHANHRAVTPESSLDQPTSTVAAPSLAVVEADLAKIDQLIAEGEDVEANFLLSNMYWKQPAVRTHIMERLRTVAYRIYFAPTPHYMTAHAVAPGDALQKIAKEYDISWEYLAKLNRTDAQKIRPGQKLKVIQGPFSAVVDLSDRELTVHSHGHFVARFDVGVGQDHPAPVGKFQVLDKQRDPTYYGAAGVVEHDDPSNPLGEHWLDLGEGVCLHGTPDNVSLTASQTQGCIRLKSRDVADLYDLLTTGAEVTVRR
ncbi:MAG: LysM peptidoglycan-binding domain-containing protein [Planctomycetota bacterium]|nr:MAG: LysM peptidoglycan-binding domain-containing protein [Planctomycetota bacterium]